MSSDAETVRWKGISLTYVEYEEGDFIGYILAWISLLPFCICVSFVALIIIRRDLHTMSYFLGILLDEFINFCIKYTIKEPRPPRGRTNLTTQYGMPSSHSQLIWFFFSYLLLFLLVRLYKNYNWVDDIWKYVASFCGFCAAFLVSFSRVYLGYHTIKQVLWGSILGSVFGVLWFGFVHFVLTQFFPYIASHRIGEFLMLRDSSLIPNVMWFEYTSTRVEARSRQRKLVARKSQ